MSDNKNLNEISLELTQSYIDHVAQMTAGTSLRKSFILTPEDIGKTYQIIQDYVGYNVIYNAADPDKKSE